MQIVATHKFDIGCGRYSIASIRDFTFWIAEREWRQNLPNVSCVPRGEYRLVPHDSKRYPRTWALEGLTVSHWPDPLKTRSTCVIHAVRSPSALQGCLSAASSIREDGTLVGYNETTERLLIELSGAQFHDLILI